MAAGQRLTQADFNNQISNLAIRLNTLLAFNIPQMQAKLLELGAAGLMALEVPPNYPPMTAEEADDLLNAMNELYDLSQCYIGTKIITAGAAPGDGVPADGDGHDFRRYPSVIWGFGYQYP